MSERELLGDYNGYPLNDELEDLKVPLDRSWNLAKLKSGDLDIKLYGQKISPPCAKIRYIMEFYAIPYTNMGGQNKKGSPYKKMPVLDIGDRQINDSYIIVKNLSPICAGAPMTPKQLELERMSTFELMIALEKATMNSADLRACGAFAGPPFSLIFGCCAPCLVTAVGAAGKGPGADGFGGGPEPKPELKTLDEYNQIYTNELGGKAFFGGAQPSITDVSLAGLCSSFAEAGTSSLDSFLGDVGSPLQAWHDRMSGYGVSIDY